MHIRLMFTMAILAITALAMTDTKPCPACKGEGGFGVKGSWMGWSPCKACNGTGKQVK